MPRRTRLKGMSEPKDQLPVRGPVGCFVYLLFVEGRSGLSGYVGHTATIQARMLDHRRKKGGDKSSSALFALAQDADAGVRLAILEKVEGLGQKDKVYLQREALWYFRFLDAGWNLPNAQFWAAQFRRPVDLDFRRLDTASFISDSVDLDEWLKLQGWTGVPD